MPPRLIRSFALLWCALLAASSVAAQSNSRPLALPDYYRVVTLQSPAISPNGFWVAFIKTRIVESENRRSGELWLVSTDGTVPARQISTPGLNASNPRWSPDGKLLAFSGRGSGETSAEDEGGAIWFVNVEQSFTVPAHIPGVGGTPIFSPDNKWIAFTRRVARPKARAYTDEAEQLINSRFRGRAYEWLNYRFDQRGYLPDPRDPNATPAEELFVVPLEGGDAKQLTQAGVNVHGVAWRADGGALAFTANTHQRDEYLYEREDLFVVTLDGQTKRLTDDGYNNLSPAWSPDGRTIAFRRELGLSAVIAAKQDHGAPVDTCTIPAAGGAVNNLTADWDLIPGAPNWSTDGKSLYFSAGIGGNEHLFRVAAAGGAVQQVTTGARHLTGFSISNARQTMTYIVTDSAHPDELYVAAADGKSERRLTSFNDLLIQEVTPIAAERILYPSKDGTQIEGWVLKPRGYNASRRWPLILMIHGGPHGAFGNEFNFEQQLFAANGYLVVYANPRGSTNYGEKFLWATWGAWGNLDFDDVMCGVDYARAHYSADDQRLGVTGYSYGGFLTNWTITHTTRFAAAITGAGVTNWISDYGTSDIPRTKESEFYGPPWDPRAHELLEKQSPLTYAADAKTPTLFMHGESDMRVPIEEGEQMYVALRKNHVPARFVRFPESYHGGWTPWNMVYRYYEELQWWGRFLNGADASTGN
jgi:dipeptidyl aminopeptidase/acylaminoacyl peptidase